ncbi:intradiol ring-cleavage dioxygenase [Piscinibacter koreensis]|uniref:Intradiol ring-cleavage dioxygenase n=1 Tax=Piscinibacter koreensis TaxID=2742824 RepID=A0A7Y6TUX8_9BURK|nr:intradiol ring-cleavage dioxygenase [Schlegelella koreensis]NUZ04341.1 intradiol ring-cleavage dioxygenase [Schlegelella koreensis]
MKATPLPVEDDRGRADAAPDGTRRRVLHAALGAAVLGVPAFATARGGLPPITEGPFYPPASWRARTLDVDADLTTVRSGNGSAQRALGEHLDLLGVVSDADGRTIDGATVEIWQCDVFASYRHPHGAGARVDAGFQGFGESRSDARGAVRFRTIRPVAYPGRTPHIHVKVRHPSFGELTSQLFVAGEPGNARDGLWRSLPPEAQARVAMALRAAPAGSGVRWVVEQALVVG